MDSQTVRTLSKLNSEFYENNAESFSETRSAPWTGWKRCVDSARKILEKNGKLSRSGGTSGEGLRVFDLASGNFRFEHFLSSRLPDAHISFYTLDNCSEFIQNPAIKKAALEVDIPSIEHQDLDVLDTLLEGVKLTESLNAPLCDLSVSFGFLHHVPSADFREEILHGLIKQTLPGGVVAVSFWQFMKNDALREKALVTHRAGLEALGLPELEENDYLLGWQNLPGVYRYCHSFTDGEIDELIASLGDEVQVISRFVSDGRTDDLNTYVVLQVC